MPGGAEENKRTQRRASRSLGDEQKVEEHVHVQANEVIAKTERLNVGGDPVVVISKPVAKAIALGLIVVVILICLQTWQTLGQSRTISALRCTVQNQSNSLDNQSVSLGELVILRQRQDHFNELLSTLIIAIQRGDQEEVDRIVDQIEEEQKKIDRSRDAETRAQGSQGPRGPDGPQGPQGQPGTNSTPTATSTTLATTTTRRPVITLPPLPILPIVEIESTEC